MNDLILIACSFACIFSLLRIGFSFAENKWFSVMDNMFTFVFTVLILIFYKYPNG